MAATITIHGVEYNVEKDFSWQELMLVEELGGNALGNDRAFESMSTLAACVYVVIKRTEADLTWEDFISRPMDLDDERDEGETPKPAAAKRAPKARPTRAAAARR